MGWGGNFFLPQKIVLIIPGTVYEVPEFFLKNGPRASHPAIVNIGGPENFSHDSAPAAWGGAPPPFPEDKLRSDP